MTSEQRIFVVGAGAVLVVASVGAAASRLFGFQYWLLAGVSLVIYVSVGAAAVRAGASGWRATALGAAVGLVDVTLGWAISAAIGPGQLQDSPFSGITAVLMGGLTALILYTIAAGVGALAARRAAR